MLKLLEGEIIKRKAIGTTKVSNEMDSNQQGEYNRIRLTRVAQKSKDKELSEIASDLELH